MRAVRSKFLETLGPCVVHMLSLETSSDGAVGMRAGSRVLRFSHLTKIKIVARPWRPVRCVFFGNLCVICQLCVVSVTMVTFLMSGFFGSEPFFDPNYGFEVTTPVILLVSFVLECVVLWQIRVGTRDYDEYLELEATSIGKVRQSK